MFFKGTMVALVTPMHQDGSLDKQAVQGLVEWHIQSHTEALVVAGTTGEACTLSVDEQFELISLVVEQAAGRIPVIAGTGTNATHTTRLLTENAKRAGAKASLVVTPYYNKPTQQGLFEHYQAVAQLGLPVILYNVPGRTGCDILPETVERLSQLDHIIGIKDATGNLKRAQAIMERCPASFAVYSGDDATALEWMRQGARGVISVTANIAPQKMRALCDAALNGNHALANDINHELALLHQRLFLESNPIPVKWALHQMGKIKSGIRLPLTPLDPKYHQPVKEAMQQAGVMDITQQTGAH